MFDNWVAACPLHYTSPNAPKKRDVLGTMVLSILAGHRSHHSGARRWRQPGPAGDGASEDAVRRALKKMPERRSGCAAISMRRRCWGFRGFWTWMPRSSHCSATRKERAIIPARLMIDTWDPGIAGYGSQSFGVGDHGVSGLTGGRDEGALVLKPAVREEAFAQVEPDALDRVQLGAVSRQRNRSDVGGDDEVLGAMPSGLVHDQQDLDVGGQGLGEIVKKADHRLGVGFWHDQGEVGAGGRAHGGEKVGGLEAPVTQPEGTLAAQPPAMGASPLLTDPGMGPLRPILEPDVDALAGMTGGGFHQLGGKPAFFEGFLSLRIAFGVLGTRFLAG